MHVCFCECKCCRKLAFVLVDFMQVASTEWFLGVQIQNYVNQYNVEIISGSYCCCDDSETCASDLNDLLISCKNPSTAQPCETYFLVHIRNCLSSSTSSTCSLSKTYQLNYKSSASTFDHGILSIPFMDMELGDKVRTKISYLLILSAKIRRFGFNSLVSGGLLSNRIHVQY